MKHINWGQRGVPGDDVSGSTRLRKERTGARFPVLLAALLVCLGVTTAAAQEKSGQAEIRSGELSQLHLNQPAGKIGFPANLVPAVRTPLPVIRLRPQKVPLKFMQDTLDKLGIKSERIQPLSRAPQISARERAVPEDLKGVIEDNRLRSYWHEQTGEVEIFPALTQQKPVKFAGSEALMKRASSLAAETFARPEILAKDSTQFVIGEPHPLVGVTAEKAAGKETAGSERMLYLTYVPVWRKVNSIPVFGPGSRALIAVGNDGSIQGFRRIWKAGTAGEQVKETRSPEQVRNLIQQQLEPIARGADVSVLSVELAYYDNNVDTIVPAYRVTARVHGLPQSVPGVEPAKKPVNDNFIVRYLPIGAQGTGFLKPIASTEVQPQTPRNVKEPRAALQVPEGDPTVGRYVVRNDDSNWVADANEFWDGLNIFFGNFLFTNSQYYWAYPWEFNSSEGSFVNSVQVADNEVHGNWWFFTTYQNWGDGVDITAIPASEGYGTANHGSLDYWILHSCEVVPSAMDAPCPTDSRPWWTPWFNVFQGMHSVVGYRTIMYIDDDVGGPFGVNLRFGVPVVSAWFNATLSAPDYQSHPTATAHCGTALPMGKPSTVSVCGHQDDSVFNTSPLPPANCLINFWQP